LRRKRQRSALVGIAEHEHVSAHGIAEQRGRKPPGVHELGTLATRMSDDGALEALRRQRKIRITREIARQKFPGIHDNPRNSRFHPANPFLGPDTEMAPPRSRAGAARRDADGMNIRWRIGDANMARDCAALLRQTGHIDDADALAFQMRRHSNDGSNRNNSGPANTRDDDSLRVIEEWRPGRRQGWPLFRLGEGLAFLELRAVYSHEGRAKAIQAGIVLVAA